MSEWIKFKLIERPYYDKNGDLLGRPLFTDRYGLAKIYGGGKIYPEIDLEHKKVQERYEGKGLLLLKTDITTLEAEEIRVKDKAMQYKDSPKTIKAYNSKDFKAQRLTDIEAQTMKKDIFGVL